ncbi:MAG: glycosyltransferase family 39 protein [Chloroflexi bacterium]|nr:glycosyltransferase family 39 protein [Chloroflexota bacterium]
MVDWRKRLTSSKSNSRPGSSGLDQRRHQLLVLGILIALAFATHLYRLSAESLWWDETLTYHRAVRDIPYILSNRIALFNINTIDQHPPIYFLLDHLALSLFGSSEFALRLPSAYVTVLAVPLSYVMGRRLFDGSTGLLAAMLAAISPYYLYYGQEARPYSIAATFATASIYFFARGIIEGEARFYPIYLATALTSVLTHYLTGIMILGDAAYVAVDSLLKRRGKRLLALGGFAVIGVILAPAAQYMLFRFTILGDSRLQVSIIDVLRDLAISFTFGITVDQFDVLPYTYGLVVVALAGIAACLSRVKRQSLLYVITRLGLPVVVLYGVSQFKVIYNTRYAVFLAPMFFLLIAAGLSWMLAKQRAIGVIACIYLIGIGAFGTYHYFAHSGSIKTNFRDSIAYIEQHANQEDAIVLGDARLATVLEFYHRGDQPVYAVPSRYGEDTPEAISKQLAEIARNHRRIWYVLWISSDMDPKGLTAQTLEDHYWKLDLRYFSTKDSTVTVGLYSSSPYTIDRIPADATNVDANFNNRLALAAYRMEKVDPTLQRAWVTLYWYSKQPKLATYKMFGQLIDSNGESWAVFDGEPFKGFYPTTSWKQGELVAEERMIRITPGTPPGQYSLRLGVRDSSGAGIPVAVKDQPPQPFVQLPGPQLEVSRSDTNRSSLALSQYYDADFGDRVVLVGSDLHEKTFRPGDSLDLRLFWETKERLSQDAKVVFTLVDAQGREEVLAEQDISTMYPSTRWEPRDLVGASYRVTIPPRTKIGRYRLNLSLAQSGDAANLEVRSGWQIFRAKSLELTQVEVQGYERRYDMPTIEHPLGVDFPDVRALGFDSRPSLFTGSGAGQGDQCTLNLSANPADSLDIAIYWQPLRDVGQNYKVFVQLLDAEGKLVTQHDGIPEGGDRPTASWVGGEVIEDHHPLPGLQTIQPGAYTLIAGLYDPSTLKRLRLIDGSGDHIALGRIVIQR